MLHLGPIWYHSEPSDVPYSQNHPRPISWFGLFLQQNDSTRLGESVFSILNAFRSFFGRIEETINCFRDLQTFKNVPYFCRFS